MDNSKLVLINQMEELIKQSQDVYFSEYLRGLIVRLGQNTITTEYAAQELNRTYHMYLQRQQAMGQTQTAQPVQQPFTGAQRPVQQPMQAQQVIQQPAQQPMQAQQVIQQPVQQSMQGQPQSQVPAKQKNSMEFAVGAGVLGIVGVLFVLVAFVMLGITYMNGFIKGMCLYAIALAVLLFSELFLAKKMPKFAVGITALGISSLYLSTMLNYLYLENFNGFIAMAICVLISVIAVFISRKKDSGTIKIISFVGCYICVFPIGDSVWGMPDWGAGLKDSALSMHFFVVAAIIFIVNLMTIFLPVKKHQTVVHIFHLIANAIFSVLFAVQGSVILDEFAYILYFLVSAVLIQGLIFYRLEKPQKDRTGHFGAETAGNITAYVTTVMLMLVTFVVESCFVDFGLKLHAAVAALALVCLLLFCLYAKSNLKWIQYWLLCLVIWMVYSVAGFEEISPWWYAGAVLGIFVVSKMLSRIKALRISELIITIMTAFYALYFFAVPDLAEDICFLGAFLLSIAALHYWQSVYEEILLAVLEIFVLLNFRNELTPAVMTGILFLGIIGFNSVEIFRGRYIKVFNYINLAFMTCLYIALALEPSNMSYAIMLLLGISFIVFAFRDKFGMNFKCKHIILALFLCYMTLICDIPVPVFKSIILMFIAVGAVTAGFIIKEKKLRICGLALTLAVCGKIALHDFAGAATTEKIVLFLIVGLIVLAISGIYIALEKRIE